MNTHVNAITECRVSTHNLHNLSPLIESPRVLTVQGLRAEEETKEARPEGSNPQGQPASRPASHMICANVCTKKVRVAVKTAKRKGICKQRASCKRLVSWVAAQSHEGDFVVEGYANTIVKVSEIVAGMYARNYVRRTTLRRLGITYTSDHLRESKQTVEQLICSQWNRLSERTEEEVHALLLRLPP